MGVQSEFDFVQSVLERTRPFSDAGPEVIASIQQACEVRSFVDGEIVTRFSDDASVANGFWIVASGCIETSRTWANGRRVVFSYMMPGQMTGLLPVLDGFPVALDASARGTTVTVFVPRTPFLGTLERFPVLALGFLGMMSRRTRLDYERIEIQSLNSLRVRVAKTLLYIAREKLPRGDGVVEVPIKISQEDVAGTLGVTRQVVSGEIAWLVREGTLERRYRGVVIVDIPRLVALAGSEEPLNEFATSLFSAQSPAVFQTTD